MTPLLSSALLATQSDARLLALASAGHDRAFEAIVERYRRPLGRYLRRVLSAPLAEDVLQATFVNAWRSLRGGAEVRDLRPWLYRIAHNQAVNALSRAEPRVAADADAGSEVAATAPGPEAEAEQRDTLQRTLTAIAGLPDRQRAALVAVAVEDRAHPDVAQELGLTEGALRQLIHRARTTLRAAATALVPIPLVTAVAGGSDAGLGRVAEVAAGAGGAGLGVKTGAALLAAGAMVVGAPAVHQPRAHPDLPRAAAVARADASPAPRVVRAAPVRPAARPATYVTAPAPRAHHPPPTTQSSGHGHGTRGVGHAGADHRGSDDGSASSPAAVTEHRDGPSTAGVEPGSGRSGPSEDTTPETMQPSGASSGEDGSATPDSLIPVQTPPDGTSESSGRGSGDDVASLP